MHALFLLEDRFGIEPCVDGSIRFTNEAIQSCVCTWRSWKEFLEEGNYKSRPVICLETGERFESISLVSRMLGISKSNVFHAMKNGSAVHGIHFYYGDELKPDDSFFKPKRRRKVRCTETGVVYESIKDAAERNSTTERKVEKDE